MKNKYIIKQKNLALSQAKLKRDTYKTMREEHRSWKYWWGFWGLPNSALEVVAHATRRIRLICKNINEEELAEEARSDEAKANSKNTSQSLPREIPSDVKGSKGFCGLPLMFIPNIRKSEVNIGTTSKILNFFGINKKLGTSVTLYLGPNKKANRYLKYQYIRLIRSIGGRILYEKVFSEACNKTIYVPHVIWIKKQTSVNLLNQSLDERKKLKANFRKFWAIALNLLVNSQIYRQTLLIKTLGKKDRWFHRDYWIHPLAGFNEDYVRIVKRRKTQTPMKRSWIPQINKFRPLAVAPIPWRMYTGGLANFLYVYLNCSWPENQHGYTCGRGVNTAWTTILTEVIKCAFIFEFDLVGYFNNITHRCVARTLADSNVPKYIIILIMEVTTSDIRNITQQKAAELLDKEKYPDPFDFVKDWEKHEYIPNFRLGFRPRGFGQGNSLSPIVSVFPLLLTKLLKQHGIDCISYCDDGILYGNVYADYLTLLQDILTDGDTGVQISAPKSSWVKLRGKWIHPLKFVGMVYDPETGILSGSTRNGSTLPMSIDLIGLVSDSQKYTANILELEENAELIKQWGDNYKPLDLSANPLNQEMIFLKSYGFRIPSSTEFDWNKWNFITCLIYIINTFPSEDWSISQRLLCNDLGIWQYYFNMERIDRPMAENILRTPWVKNCWRFR
jgi:hypothetical protein